MTIPAIASRNPTTLPLAAVFPPINPAKRDDGDGLDVADYCTASSSSFIDDVKLRCVDHACTQPTLYTR